MVDLSKWKLGQQSLCCNNVTRVELARGAAPCMARGAAPYVDACSCECMHQHNLSRVGIQPLASHTVNITIVT